MNIVSFLCPRLDHPRWDNRYFDLLDVLQFSCDRLKLRHVVLTDDPNLNRKLKRPLDTFLVHQAPRPLMQATNYCQYRWITSGNWMDADTLLVGADCIMLKDPKEAFAGVGDMGFTIRYDGGKHPINTGCIVIRESARNEAGAFFYAVARDTETHWCADQEALHRALMPMPESVGTYWRSGMPVTFLPMDHFNIRPLDPDDASMLAAPMLHFRGKWDRKWVMIEWAKRHLGYPG